MDVVEERQRLLKDLRIYLKILLSTCERTGDATDVVFDNSIHLDRFCLALERIFSYGLKGINQSTTSI
jgi:hypothetical protein